MYKRITKIVLDDISIRVIREDGVNILFHNDVNVVLIF